MLVNDLKIAVIGLGYVGLPLAVEFGKIQEVIGFDINKTRINELQAIIDKTLEISSRQLKLAKFLRFSHKIEDLNSSNCFIITVPTPIDQFNQPDLSPILKATEMIAKILKKGDIVIYESTVYPGLTEEKCMPLLEKYSKLKFNQDFYLGYSPERINPGDKKHRLVNIKKITSGSTAQIADLIDELYRQIIKAGTYKAESIKIAEAAKVIENTQRDINIALINELAIIFNKLGIDSEAVLKAARTKWNFLPFEPGFVGGHCIGVDPYYLTYKAQSVGHYPEVILAGRKTNDAMGEYVADQLIKKMSQQKIGLEKAKVLIMGFSFKENCPDIRNTKIIDIVLHLKKFNCELDIYDPWVNIEECEKEYKVKPIKKLKKISKAHYDAIVLAVAHQKFRQMGIEKIRSFTKEKHIIYDLKYLFSKEQTDLRL